MRLGKYQLIRRLAVGGMAEIYLAKATGIEGFEKMLVLKRILPQHAQHEEFINMFLNEARLAATLHHPNIAQTYDIGTDGGSYFFTMEYVHGEDMRQICKAATKTGKGLSLEHAVSIVIGLCAGLHHAHEKRAPDGSPLGIVHRDVSPSNVIVTYDGMVKVVDFGIAKATTHRAETRVGTLKGKIAYMSPEQCRGERLDRRADVFAIGILLYEFTTGTRLFQGDNEFAILNQIVNDDVPPPSTVRPDFPEALERIVMKSLRRNRDQRYATAQALQLDLETFARENRLGTSSVALGQYMEDLFGKRDGMVTGEGPTLDSMSLPLPAPPHTISRDVALGLVPRPGADTNPGYGGRPMLEHSGMLAAESASVPVSLRRRTGLYVAITGVVAAAGIAVAIVLTRTPSQSGAGVDPAKDPGKPAVVGAQPAAPQPAADPPIDPPPPQQPPQDAKRDVKPRPPVKPQPAVPDPSSKPPTLDGPPPKARVGFDDPAGPDPGKEPQVADPATKPPVTPDLEVPPLPVNPPQVAPKKKPPTHRPVVVTKPQPIRKPVVVEPRPVQKDPPPVVPTLKEQPPKCDPESPVLSKACK